MKILLLGEFSAVHKNLKEALIQFGHEVVIASAGDGWKAIPGDLVLPEGGKNFKSKVQATFKLINAARKMRGYDVVQLIYPSIFPHLNNIIVNRIIDQNEKTFLMGAGADSVTTDFLKNRFKYPELYNALSSQSSGIFYPERQNVVNYHNSLLEKINGYIPLMYEYAQGYRDIGYPRLFKTIPIPMNVHAVKYKENRPNRKIVFFHGLNREAEKGTPMIRDAMENLKKRYPNDVEIVLEGKMPLHEYLKLLERVNVVIDQALCVSYGVNAVYSMAMGKIAVGGGSDAECRTEFGVTSCPMVSIEPDARDIEMKLVGLLDRRDEFVSWGFNSRQYVEHVHDYLKIARQFLDTWQNDVCHSSIRTKC